MPRTFGEAKFGIDAIPDLKKFRPLRRFKSGSIPAVDALEGSFSASSGDAEQPVRCRNRARNASVMRRAPQNCACPSNFDSSQKGVRNVSELRWGTNRGGVCVVCLRFCFTQSVCTWPNLSEPIYAYLTEYLNLSELIRVYLNLLGSISADLRLSGCI